jgi:hypothetical protein
VACLAATMMLIASAASTLLALMAAGVGEWGVVVVAGVMVFLFAFALR